MASKCDAEVIFQPIHDLMEKLSNDELKSKEDKKNLEKLLDQYWATDCPEDNECMPGTCVFAKPIAWIEYPSIISGTSCVVQYLKVIRDRRRGQNGRLILLS